MITKTIKYQKSVISNPNFPINPRLPNQELPTPDPANPVPDKPPIQEPQKPIPEKFPPAAMKII